MREAIVEGGWGEDSETEREVKEGEKQRERERERGERERERDNEGEQLSHPLKLSIIRSTVQTSEFKTVGIQLTRRTRRRRNGLKMFPLFICRKFSI